MGIPGPPGNTPGTNPKKSEKCRKMSNKWPSLIFFSKFLIFWNPVPQKTAKLVPCDSQRNSEPNRLKGALWRIILTLFAKARDFLAIFDQFLHRMVAVAVAVAVAHTQK